MHPRPPPDTPQKKNQKTYFGDPKIFQVEGMDILKQTRPDTWHKMRLVCVLFTFENNTGHTDRRTDRRTDTTSYRDATVHLKTTSE